MSRSARLCRSVFGASATLVALVAGLVPAVRAAAADDSPTITTYPSPAPHPTGIVAGPDGNMWFTTGSENLIGRITPTGDTITFPAGTAGNFPIDIASGPDGNLWYTTGNGGRINRMTPSGTVTEFLIGNRFTRQITAGPDGNLWFTEFYRAADGSFTGGAVGRITPAGVVTEFPAGSRPAGITTGPDGNLWFVDPGFIGRMTPAGAFRLFNVGLPAGADPYGITTGPDGNLWFTQYGTGDIGRITPTGEITTFEAGTVLDGPLDITTARDGNLWYTEYDGASVNRLTTSGVVTSYPTGFLQDIARAPDGTVWFNDVHEAKIGHLVPATTLPPSMEVSGLSPSSAVNGWGPWERDRSNGEQAAGDGRTISIAGQSFARGLGVHAASSLTYAVPSGCRRLDAVVGVDDEVGDRGSVVFEVWGDGLRLAETPTLRGASPAYSLSVDVTGRSQLRLAVTDAGDGKSSDHASWGAPTLRCAPPSSVQVSGLSPSSAVNGWGPWERDRSNGEQAAGDGRTISIAGQSFARGLGVHAASSLTYAVPAGCTGFDAVVGVDDEVGDHGSVVFEVWGDGVRLAVTPTLRGASPAYSLSADVSGRSQLRLVVTDAGDGKSSDHASWGAPTLRC